MKERREREAGGSSRMKVRWERYNVPRHTELTDIKFIRQGIQSPTVPMTDTGKPVGDVDGNSDSGGLGS